MPKQKAKRHNPPRFSNLNTQQLIRTWLLENSDERGVSVSDSSVFQRFFRQPPRSQITCRAHPISNLSPNIPQGASYGRFANISISWDLYWSSSYCSISTITSDCTAAEQRLDTGKHDSENWPQHSELGCIRRTGSAAEVDATFGAADPWKEKAAEIWSASSDSSQDSFVGQCTKLVR
jgi:hypothetical protein